MAKCAYCNSTLFFGGVRDRDLRFCNRKCYQEAALLGVAKVVPDEQVRMRVTAINQGPCPLCKGAGPVDVHTSHSVWSALVITRWSSSPRISCLPCGRKAKLLATLGSVTLGWWGFPWGLVLTPIQAGKNLWGLFAIKPSATGSPQLEKVVRLWLAAELRRMKAADGTPPRLGAS